MKIKMFKAVLLFFCLASLGAAPQAGGKTAYFRVGSPKAEVDGALAFIDKDNHSVRVLSKNGETYLPARFLAESFGGKITQNADKTYTVAVNGVKSVLSAKNVVYAINGKQTRFKNPPLIDNDRLFIPVEAAGAVTGKAVFEKNGLVALSGDKKSFPEAPAAVTEKLSELGFLESFKSQKAFADYMDKIEAEADRGTPYMVNDMRATETAADAPEAGGFASAKSAQPVGGAGESADFSSVNAQVAGVDEADIVRPYGDYIYACVGNSVRVIKARPPENMSAAARIDLGGAEPVEIYADNEFLTVIAREYIYNAEAGYFGGARVTTLIYGVKDKTKPELLKKTSVKGNYLTSRKTGDALYVIANDNFNRVYPVYYDGGEEKPFAPCDIFILPDAGAYGSTTVVGIALDDLQKEPFVTSLLGGAENVYVSAKNMFIVNTSYDYGVLPAPQSDKRGPVYAPSVVSSVIRKFALSAGACDYVGEAEAPGTILNQFSMDEYASHFRIATNVSDMNGQSNAVYIFDRNLTLKSQITGIAPGERIYSTRFMGEKGYMVTFKQTDPLFVIDLAPEAPKILGELKIPGYSDYLHPYSENILIGFGKDAQVASYGTAYYQGMKIAAFDVTDVYNPKQLHAVTIGGRGTDSALLSNHKALLFDKGKNILAFPVTVYSEAKTENAWDYGELTFLGAYAYNFTPETGFKKIGEITHDTASSGGAYRYPDYNAAINRLMYIGDYLYAASNGKISAHDIKTLGLAGELSF